MSSEQKKFAPELMGGDSLFSRIRKALSSVLDIGKSARVRLGRITTPDYDVIAEVRSARDEILGNTFEEGKQKRAPPRDVNRTKVEGVIKALTDMGDEEPTPGKGDTKPVEEPVDTDVPVDPKETQPDKGEDPTDEKAEDIVHAEPPSEKEILIDKDGELLRVGEDIGKDAKEYYDVIAEEQMHNILSIEGHDRVIEQTSIDLYGTNADNSLKFPESRSGQKQTTLDIQMEVSEIRVEEVVEPWYTDADLMRIGIRAATEDSIESITPLMEQFDEPAAEEDIIDDVDAELIESAVKTMTDDSVKAVAERFLEAAKVAETVITAMSDKVEQGCASDVEPSTENVADAEVVVAQAPDIAGVPEAEDTGIESEDVSVDVIEPVVEVEATPVAESGEVVPPKEKNGVSISFRFGTGAATGSSVGIKFRFGTASE